MLILVNSHKLEFLLHITQSNISIVNIKVNFINMVNCSAIGCTNQSDTPSPAGLSFHKIPSSKKPLLRQMVT